MSDTFTDLNNHVRLGGTLQTGGTETFDSIDVTNDATVGNDLTVTAGDATVTAGDLIVTAGDLTVTAGSATIGGVATAAAAAAATNLPRLSQLTSALTITSGSLPNTGAWSSGTAKQNPVARQIVVVVEVVTDGTANAATCAIAVSPDDMTYTTVGTPGASAAVNTVGAVTLLASVILPAGWFVKLTLSHAAVAASVYY